MASQYQLEKYEKRRDAYQDSLEKKTLQELADEMLVVQRGGGIMKQRLLRLEVRTRVALGRAKVVHGVLYAGSNPREWEI